MRNLMKHTKLNDVDRLDMSPPFNIDIITDADYMPLPWNRNEEKIMGQREVQLPEKYASREELEREIKEMHLKNVPVKQIAKYVELKVGTVHNIIKTYRAAIEAKRIRANKELISKAWR